MSIFETLEAWDVALFLHLNGSNSPFWDAVMVWLSGKTNWIPMYVLLLYPVWRIYKKKGMYILLAIGVLILLADQLSVHLFKNMVERYRPCHNLDIQHLVHTVNGKCGGKFGFLSSHATNSFALASFLYLVFKRDFSWLGMLLIVWASIVSYSRIYLGVHYPADVLAGGLFGMLLAFMVNFVLGKTFLKTA